MYCDRYAPSLEMLRIRIMAIGEDDKKGEGGENEKRERRKEERRKKKYRKKIILWGIK